MILGIDPGGRRVGIAVAELETRFARPFEVIDSEKTDPVARIAELVRTLEAEAVVVGRPTRLRGGAGPAVSAQQELVAALQKQLRVPVHEHDERFTTVLAERGMQASGASGKARRARRDAVAAQVMLQDYLDSST